MLKLSTFINELNNKNCLQPNCWRCKSKCAGWKIWLWSPV